MGENISGTGDTKNETAIGKRIVVIIIGLVAVLIASIVAIFVMRQNDADNEYVRVYYDGELIEEYSLEEDGTYRIEAVKGEYNIVEIKDGYVSVTEANCANQTCVQTGKVGSSATPIVCLPHKLVIRIEGEGSEVDAVAE